MDNSKNKQKGFSRSLVIVFGLMAIGLGWLTLDASLKYSQLSSSLEDNKKAILIDKARLSAAIVDQVATLIKIETDKVAQSLSQSEFKFSDQASKSNIEVKAKTIAQLGVYCVLARPHDGSGKIDALVDCEIDNYAELKRLDGVEAYSARVFGSAIALDRQTFSPDDATLWSTYYYEQGEKHKDLHQFDYTNKFNDGFKWFHQPVATRENLWVDPYLDDAGETYMITYSSIIYDANRCDASDENCKPVGVVTADLSINQLESIIEKLISGRDGFGALTYGNGRYLYHPERSYVKAGKTLRDIADEQGDVDRYRAAELAKKGEGESIAHISTTTGEASWMVVEPLKNTGWSLQNTFFKDSFYLEDEVDSLRQHEMKLISAGLACVFFLLLTIVQLTRWNALATWIASILFSLLLAAGIGNAWDLALNSTKPKNSEDQVISSSEAIAQKQAEYRSRLNGSKRESDTILYLPTGIYVQTIELKNANEVNVSGRIWQVIEDECSSQCQSECSGQANEGQSTTKTPLNQTNNCERCMDSCAEKLDVLGKIGVQFASARNVKLTELKAEINEDGQRIVSWWFQADVVTMFDYSRYPLEVEYLDLHILPSAISNDVQLIPDVASYKFGSNRKAGLSEEVFVPGWTIFRSYFTLKDPEKSRPTFGMKQNFDNEAFYDMHFKIGLKRVFIDAFISNLTPLIVVAIILFSVTLLPSSIDISRILGICVSVFFVVVFSHLAIRRTISTGEIFYLEYFFFAIYVALLLVPVDAFRETLGIRNRIMEYKNGLIFKVMYWPSLMLVFYLVTINKFM